MSKGILEEVHLHVLYEVGLEVKGGDFMVGFMVGWVNNGFALHLVIGGNKNNKWILY